jgi:zinc/manganese transport system permease protein
MSDWAWLGTPILASLLLTLALVPLGQQVLQRGVVFADLAIAQWAALGSLAASSLAQPAVAAPASLAFALLAVAAVHLIMKYISRQREAMIGLLYVLAASLATLVVSRDPHGAQALAATLNGDLLWTTGPDLWPLAAAAMAVLAWTICSQGMLHQRLFLPLFALAVTASVAVAGVYVVFASLIAAPLALCQLRQRPLWQAVLVCWGGYGAGLLCSALGDWPTGPSVVLAIIGISLITVLFKSPAPTPA